MITFSPSALKWIESRLLVGIVFAGCTVALLWDLIVGFLTGGKEAQHVYRKLEQAQTWFEERRDGGDPVERMKAAVVLVHFAYFSDGPSMSMPLTVPSARRRLGEATAYVEEVERVLIEEVKVWAVFTGSQTGS